VKAPEIPLMHQLFLHDAFSFVCREMRSTSFLYDRSGEGRSKGLIGKNSRVGDLMKMSAQLERNQSSLTSCGVF